ncbi:hypothetical protein L5515_009384 [Caenorhabditis briggsae]|uniref:Uncharacterized protein n=1 Tax=Caenorhabditis briggsae TaxID=6238 RepID=A0AAE9F9N2_CAEBR|nr:hypothetical protein L5515_009384 [Caenorhabditis briggsae]
MIPGRVNKWTLSSFLLIFSLVIVKASGANSLEVRKPDTQFSKNSIETIRDARGTGGGSGNDPTTAPEESLSLLPMFKHRKNCRKPQCTFDLNKLYKKMFPECRRDDGFDCEPIPTTTSVAKIVTSERRREVSPSSSDAQINSIMRFNKWTLSSFLLIFSLAIVKTSGANSPEVRKPDTQFSKNSIETNRHPRGSGDGSGSDITTTSVNPQQHTQPTTSIEPSWAATAPFFILVDLCSNEKILRNFMTCLKEKRKLSCKADKACLQKSENGFTGVQYEIAALFRCAENKSKCDSNLFTAVDKALKDSVERHCPNPQCTFDLNKLYKKLFPECRVDDAFDCEPVTTTTITTVPTRPESSRIEEYEPPHEDLPEDFSCQNLGEKYKACEYLCQQLASMKPYKARGIDWRFLPGLFLSVGSSAAIIILFVLTKRLTKELADLNKQKPTAADDPNAKLKIEYAAALDPKNTPKKSQEVPTPPSPKNNPAAQKMRAKLLETQQNLQKLRTHTKKCVEEHKKDAASSKFQKKGAIYIPNKPEIPPPAPLPDNIILGNVEWCSDYNEMYVIGSDVDDIELDEESATSDFDESTTTKKSEKSKKNKPAAVPSNPSATQK